MFVRIYYGGEVHQKLEAVLDRCLNSSGLLHLLHQPHSPLFVAARDSA